VSTVSRAGELVGHLRDDFRMARGHLLLTVLGGSVLLPGTARKLIYRSAGASMESPPGFKLVFAGQPENLTIKDNVYMNQRVFIEAVGPVVIGSHCAIGMEVMILSSHHAVDSTGTWDPVASGRPVTIGDRVWIGARAIVLPGATIDSDVIIAAGAVVAGHCESYGVYAGVPARRIREFPQLPG
jgi:maltose O-acetyltransferase